MHEILLVAVEDGVVQVYPGMQMSRLSGRFLHVLLKKDCVSSIMKA